MISEQVFIRKSLLALKKTIKAKLDITDDIPEAYAVDTDNAELAQHADNSTTDYFRLSDENFEIKVKQDYDHSLVSRSKPRSYRIANRVAIFATRFTFIVLTYNLIFLPSGRMQAVEKQEVKITQGG